ncbi:odorant receptor 46a [Plodia interpunctella]|uniref:odorant receptor 46a n=1 Tax=Plodia interpunctella TaxID=58824 RepID=UPI0023681F83|nr:odorant receptor 46a-like [Plodia interpunctella]
MGAYKQIDCFNTNIKFFRFLGLWPTDSGKYYRYYALSFIIFFIVIYDFVYTINFLFLPRELVVFIDDTMLYCTVISIMTKTFTFYLLHDKIIEILSVLESDMFQHDSDEAKTIIAGAKKLTIKLWKIITTFSLVANGSHIASPILAHLMTGEELVLPVFSCDFLPISVKNLLIYPLYFYQSIGMHFHVLYNMTTDGMFFGLIILLIAQLDILDLKLRNVTTSDKFNYEKEDEAIRNLNDCIIHYDEVAKFCQLIQDVFSVMLFVQFGTASMIICLCLFRLTLPASTAYYVYIMSYVFVMIFHRAVPCWYGTLIIEKSTSLGCSIYDCDWTPRSGPFKSSMRLFVERVNKPLIITSGKMVMLSLKTFTSIINAAYSFYTLLRHMQSREN